MGISTRTSLDTGKCLANAQRKRNPLGPQSSGMSSVTPGYLKDECHVEMNGVAGEMGPQISHIFTLG